MKKWYKAGVTKASLVILAIICGTMFITSFVWFGINAQDTDSLLPTTRVAKFEESSRFKELLSSDSGTIAQGIKGRVLREKEEAGELLDLKKYSETGEFSKKDESGFSYRIADLLAWGSMNGYTMTHYNELMYEMQSTIPEGPSVIVCQKADDSYQYFTVADFHNIVKEEDYTFSFGQDNTYNEDPEGYYSFDDFVYANEGASVYGKDNAQIYKKIWMFTGVTYAEEYKTISGKSILEIANTEPEWNGKLQEMYEMLGSALDSFGQAGSGLTYMEENFRQGDTNLTYVYANKTDGIMQTNDESLKNNPDKIKEIGNGRSAKYVIVKPRLKDFDTNIEKATATEWISYAKELMGDDYKDKDFMLALAVDGDYPVKDNYYEQSEVYKSFYRQAGDYTAFFILGLVGTLISVLWLTVVAGRRSGDEELHLNMFDRLKTELAAILVIGAEAFVIAAIGSQFGFSTSSARYAVANHSVSLVWVVIFFASMCLFLVGYLSLVRRIKGRTLWKNSILKYLANLVQIAFRHVNILWRTVLLFILFVLIHWMAFSADAGTPIFLMFIAEIAGLVYLVRTTLGRAAIHKGIKRIADGDLNYKIPYNFLKGEQLEIAMKINNIGEGLDKAVEESLRSERMKTDLITNVSHDIKTPLTSIINYIGLLKQENFTDPKLVKYLDILEEKAMRLKTLTEDVVEASKASSGNINLEYMNINLVELIQQTSGEFAERLESRKLTEILSLPETEVVVRLDSRQTWRVLENIYNNAVKYSQPGTRVYSHLEVKDQRAYFSLKNISEEELNITPDELTERFIRGDASRSKEGSGLGLSIAKSLTELQGGTFTINLDGDLFKVTISFPIINK